MEDAKVIEEIYSDEFNTEGTVLEYNDNYYIRFFYNGREVNRKLGGKDETESFFLEDMALFTMEDLLSDFIIADLEGTL